jgi:protein tyrosine phosphatase (PTP) superfamily phosphohydrolase (DUF442 family)
MPTEIAPNPAPAPSRRFALAKHTVAGAVVGLLLCVFAECYNVLIGSNFHEALPGSVYRCAQLSGPQLAYYLKKKKIRTVINLRGCCEPSPWYLDECRACSALNVSLEDIGFSAGRMPAVDAVRELVDVLENCEYPILVHCHRGIDRTGMTVAIALLLRTDCSLDEALYQLGPRYGHVPVGHTGNIDRFFVMYQEYLRHKGVPHSRPTFRRWAVNEYCPGECRCRIEVLDTAARVPVGRPFPVHIRCHNTSVKPWHLKPNTDAGIHAVWQLFDEQGNELPGGFGRSGLFRAEVQPGDSIDLTLSIPPLRRAGSYQMRIDMKDEQHAFFFQLGEDPLLWDLVAE